MSFGVMGGPMQPQGHVQMMVRIFGGGQDVQAAADAPRWFVDEDGSVALEDGFDPSLARSLAQLGHRIVPGDVGIFGGAQLVAVNGDGYVAGSDPRQDGMAAGF
jgi:gamma-glutamyltranspeptidase/glutathione hydrolase